MPKPPRQRPTGQQLPSTLTPNPQPIHVGSTAVLPDSGTTAVPESGSTELPRYRRLARKDTRLRNEQIAALAELRRAVSRQRRDRTERITENTLIRVAVDLLLTHAGELRGDTEDQLRAAVGAVLPESGTSEVR